MRIRLILFILGFSLTINGQPSTPYPDNSFPNEEYTALGMPNLDKPWHSIEYDTVIALLRSIVEVDKWSLPRKESTNSGLLFQYIINTKHLDILTDPTVSLNQRVQELEGFASHTSQLLSLYSEKDANFERFGREHLEVAYFSAYYARNTVLFIEEIGDKLPPDRKASADFQQNRQVMQEVLEENSRYILTCIQNANRFSDIDMQVFLIKTTPFLQESWSLM